jgi:hypothetical protein
VLLKIIKIRNTKHTETIIAFSDYIPQPDLPDLSKCHSQMDTSQNSSQSQITQKVTAISGSSTDNRFSEELS